MWPLRSWPKGEKRRDNSFAFLILCAAFYRYPKLLICVHLPLNSLLAATTDFRRVVCLLHGLDNLNAWASKNNTFYILKQSDNN